MRRRDRHVTTPKPKDIDRSLVLGIAWTGAARWTGQIVSWAVLLYAARVLTPADFGLVAMAMVPIGLARMIEDLGLDAALVQNRQLDAQQISALGGLAVVFGIALCLVYVAASGLIAEVYGEPKVAAVVAVLALLFVLDALQIVPRALLQRDLKFGWLACVNGLQLVVSALVLGAGAALGVSYWALVLNHVISNAAVLVLLVFLRPHKLAWPREWRRLMRSIRFGGSMLVSRIAWYGYSNADQLIVGRYLGKDALGAYSFALTFAQVPVAEVSSLSGKVVPGVFSAVQSSARQLTRYFLLLTEAVSLITVPACIGIALVASDFVPIVIGPQWDAVILPLQILAIYTCVVSVTVLWSHVLIWTGHPHINMYMALLALLLLPPAFYFAVRAGTPGVAAAWVIVFPLTLVPLFWFMTRIIPLTFRRFLRCLGPAIISSALMSIAVLLMKDVVAPHWGAELRLAGCVLVGVAVYTAALLALFNRRIKLIVAVIARATKGRPVTPQEGELPLSVPETGP